MKQPAVRTSQSLFRTQEAAAILEGMSLHFGGSGVDLRGSHIIDIN